jgi:hypothetical protein
MSALHVAEVLLQPQSIAAVALCLTTLVFIHHRFTRASRSPLPPSPPQSILGNSLPDALYASSSPLSTFASAHQSSQRVPQVRGMDTGVRPCHLITSRPQLHDRRRADAGRHRYHGARGCLARRSAAEHRCWRNALRGDAHAPHTCRRSVQEDATVRDMQEVVMGCLRSLSLCSAMHAHLQPKLISTYSPTLMKNARRHILDIIETPERHQDHAKRCVSVSSFSPFAHLWIPRYSAAVVMALAYGKNPKSYDDPEVVAVNRCLTRLGNTLRPGVWKVEAYPFLRCVLLLFPMRVGKLTMNRYVPGYLKELQDGHAEELNLFKTQLLELKKKAVRSLPLSSAKPPKLTHIPPGPRRRAAALLRQIPHRAPGGARALHGRDGVPRGLHVRRGLGHQRLRDLHLRHGRRAAPRGAGARASGTGDGGRPRTRADDGGRGDAAADEGVCAGDVQVAAGQRWE